MESSVLENSYEEKKVSPWPTAMKWGIIGAVFVIAVQLISYLAGLMPNGQSPSGGGNVALGFGITLMNWVVFTLIYFLAVKEYREKLGGYITFGQGFKAAWFSALIKAVIVLVWSFILYTFIIPDFSEIMLEAVVEQYEEMGMDDEQIEMSMGMVEMMMNPVFMGISAFFSTLAGGAILSLIAAAIGQRNRPIS